MSAPIEISDEDVVRSLVTQCGRLVVENEHLREMLEWSADEIDAARVALVEHGCTDDHLKNCERAAHNARRNAAAQSEFSISGLSQEELWGPFVDPQEAKPK